MKNKQHEYILKAFIKSGIPAVVRRNAPELIVIDSVIGGYCTRLLRGAKSVEFRADGIISESDKAVFSELINCAVGTEKDDLAVYYRLAILA